MKPIDNTVFLSDTEKSKLIQWAQYATTFPTPSKADFDLVLLAHRAIAESVETSYDEWLAEAVRRRCCPRCDGNEEVWIREDAKAPCAICHPPRERGDQADVEREKGIEVP